jgi:hypothetical protein
MNFHSQAHVFGYKAMRCGGIPAAIPDELNESAQTRKPRMIQAAAGAGFNEGTAARRRRFVEVWYLVKS